MSTPDDAVIFSTFAFVVIVGATLRRGRESATHAPPSLQTAFAPQGLNCGAATKAHFESHQAKIRGEMLDPTLKWGLGGSIVRIGRNTFDFLLGCYPCL